MTMDNAGDRPPRYEKITARVTKTPPFTVGRGPVPRHAPVYRTIAGDRPPRYGNIETGRVHLRENGIAPGGTRMSLDIFRFHRVKC